MTKQQIKEMTKLRKQGLKLREIGEIYNISHERVRQLTPPIERKLCKCGKVASKQHDYIICNKCYSEELQKNRQV